MTKKKTDATAPERRMEARAEQRAPLSLATYFYYSGGLADCEIVDLSAGGARIVTDAALTEGALLRLTMPTAAPVTARVASFHGGIARLTFLDAEELARSEIRGFVFGRLGDC